MDRAGGLSRNILFDDGIDRCDRVGIRLMEDRGPATTRGAAA